MYQEEIIYLISHNDKFIVKPCLYLAEALKKIFKMLINNNKFGVI
jgi:hypothetical protein